MSIKDTLEGASGCYSELRVLAGQCLSGSYDGTTRKRDCETGQLIGEPQKGERYILALNYSSFARWKDNCMREERRQCGTVGHKWTDEDIWTGHSDRV